MSKVLQLNDTQIHRDSCKKRLSQVIDMIDEENITSVIIVATGPQMPGGITAKNVSAGDHYKLIGLLFDQQSNVMDLTTTQAIPEGDDA